MDSEVHPVIRNATEARTIGVVGDVYRFLATGAETHGKYAMFDALVLPGGGPPPHIHSREEEAFYVLEGEVTFQVGTERRVLTTGMFANMPVGQLHSFRNESNQPARMLITIAPAGLEDMFFEIGTPLAHGAVSIRPPDQAEIDALLEIAPRYGIRILLPAH